MHFVLETFFESVRTKMLCHLDLKKKGFLGCSFKKTKKQNKQELILDSISS